MQKLTTDISVALQALNRDEVIGLPTETVYGLAGNAFKSEVVSKIFAVKNRPFFDPLIVHIGKFEQLSELSESIDPKLEKLMSSFWPGPLTV